jgi:hypothetical protein
MGVMLPRLLSVELAYLHVFAKLAWDVVPDVISTSTANGFPSGALAGTRITYDPGGTCSLYEWLESVSDDPTSREPEYASTMTGSLAPIALPAHA